MMPAFLRHGDKDWRNFSVEEKRILLGLRTYWQRVSDGDAIVLNQGSSFEEPFTVRIAIGWAERLAEKELG